jgi:hypothetical protein
MSASSDKMLDLLQQISMLKELDDRYRSGAKSGAATQDSKERRKKRRQLCDEMKELASRVRQKLPSQR